MNIAWVMLTCDREPSYLATTIDNLKRSGFSSSLGLTTDSSRDPNGAFARALRLGACENTDWVVTMEDDLDFAPEFERRVALWLEAHGGQQGALLHTFYSAYPQVVDEMERESSVWRFHITSFYGTQCCAFRSADALDLATFIEAQPHVPEKIGHFDFLVQDWITRTKPKHLHFGLASAPSLVQHVGHVSSINDSRWHESPSFDLAK